MTAYAGEDEEQRKHSSIAGQSANLYSHFENKYRFFFGKLLINLPQDPVILFSVIYPKDTQSYHKDTCSTMLMAVLFIIARNCKQPKCPSTKE